MTPTDATITQLRAVFDSYLERQGRADIGVDLSECPAGVHVELFGRGLKLVCHCMVIDGPTSLTAEAAAFFVTECVSFLDVQAANRGAHAPIVDRDKVSKQAAGRLALIVATQHEGDPT